MTTVLHTNTIKILKQMGWDNKGHNKEIKHKVSD